MIAFYKSPRQAGPTMAAAASEPTTKDYSDTDPRTGMASSVVPRRVAGGERYLVDNYRLQRERGKVNWLRQYLNAAREGWERKPAGTYSADRIKLTPKTAADKMEVPNGPHQGDDVRMLDPETASILNDFTVDYKPHGILQQLRDARHGNQVLTTPVLRDRAETPYVPPTSQRAQPPKPFERRFQHGVTPVPLSMDDVSDTTTAPGESSPSIADQFEPVGGAYRHNLTGIYHNASRYEALKQKGWKPGQAPHEQFVRVKGTRTFAHKQDPQKTISASTYQRMKAKAPELWAKKVEAEHTFDPTTRQFRHKITGAHTTHDRFQKLVEREQAGEQFNRLGRSVADRQPREHGQRDGDFGGGASHGGFGRRGGGGAFRPRASAFYRQRKQRF